MARRGGPGRRAGLRAAFRTLREPRYAALSALMAVVALACVGAGTWQIVRFDDKVHANDELTSNAHAPAAPVTRVLPLVGGNSPSSDAVRYRTVTATGRFDDARTGLVRLANVNDDTGYYVLTPLVTSQGTLLVVRGFVNSTANGRPPNAVAEPPTGPVTVRGRVQTGDSRADRPRGIPTGQLASVNPSAQAARSGTPTFDGYVQLLSGQPGTRRLTPIPPPDLSNPAGGAVEPQHFAYIVQWYLFAALALAAPFAMARADRREREATADADTDTDRASNDEAQPTPPVEPEPAPLQPEPVPVQTEAARRAAKLADRYGR